MAAGTGVRNGLVAAVGGIGAGDGSKVGDMLQGTVSSVAKPKRAGGALVVELLVACITRDMACRALIN